MKDYKYKLQDAIISLESLLDDGINIESYYQEYFENNPIVFNVLGYSNYFPFTKNSEMELPRDEYSNLKPEPDFVVQRKDGLFEIFEIKTPCSKKMLIDSNKYRERFTAEIISYISQVCTYADYFIYPGNRQAILEKFNLSIQEIVDVKIIIGRAEVADTEKIHKLCRKQTNKIDIITYDDILKILIDEYSNTYSYYENLPGISCHMILRFPENKNRNKGYIFESGESINKNRISLFLNEKSELIFRVIDNNSKECEVSFDLNPDYVGNWIYLLFEFGIQQIGFCMSASVNGLEKHIIIKDSKISIGKIFQNLILGSDIDINNFGIFDLSFFLSLNRTLDFREKRNQLDFLTKELIVDDTKTYMTFNGAQYMTRDSLGDLVQNDPAFRPLVGNYKIEK